MKTVSSWLPRLTAICASIVILFSIRYFVNSLTIFEEFQRLSRCHPNPKPNLILSAVDGPTLHHQIFVFMQSLEVALGQEALEAHRAGHCPPPQVAVKILVPKDFPHELDPGFKAFLRRYPSLEVVGTLPQPDSVPIVLSRFVGWAAYADSFASEYDKILVCDLDIAFQRNPFSMPLEPGIELLYFAEWRGLKIGQCAVHTKWFEGCASDAAGQYIPYTQFKKYMSLDRICDGTVYGTARAMHVYMQTMASHLEAARYKCNDQAMHIHLYYSSLLHTALRIKGIGGPQLVPNEEALFGTVSTTPMVTFNEWGEILSERGEVQCGIHQFKGHGLLTKILLNRFGWMTPVGSKMIPTVPNLVEEEISSSTTEGSNRDSHPRPNAEPPKDGLKQFVLPGELNGTCSSEKSLCSCRYNDCQIHYEDW
jgi:hypothetical protein